MARARPYDRDAAIDAATQLFWEKGFVGTSLKDLENVLGMKPGSIYAAFTSKEALYLTALERYFSQSNAALHAVKDTDASLLTALSELFLRIGQNAPDDPLSRPCMVIKTLLERSSVSEEVAQRSRDYLDRMTEEIRSVFDLAQARGELRPDADTGQIARRYLANMTALRLEAHMSNQPDALMQLAQDMADDMERYRAPSEAA